MSLALMLVIVSAVNIPQDPTARQAFQAALREGADCSRLFALRKEARGSTSVSQQAEMSRLLRSVGCVTSTSKRRPPTVSPKPETYTVRDYRIYRDVVDAPAYMTEGQVLQRTAKKYKTTRARVKASADKVLRILSDNDWFGSRASEERRASDWAKK